MTQRHYIALVGSAHACISVEEDAVGVPEWKPVTGDGPTYYQVSQEIAEEWVAEEWEE
jgi:hypothetical protein